MNVPGQTPPSALARTVARHSLGWLVAANLVGLWLACVLLWPAAGDALAPLSYGRWMPLHLDWQLYGWCALPLVGVLFAWTFDVWRPFGLPEAQWGVRAWSLALAVGGVSWLAGYVSGKLFLDWRGWTRALLPLAMVVLWGVMAVHTRSRWESFDRRARAGRGVLLAALAVVPVVFFWASGRAVYPAVNPGSGGPTGASLLGSTLGIVTIFLLLPYFLDLPRRPGAPERSGQMIDRVIFGALGASWVVFALLRHGDASHHEPAQRLGLAVLLAWVPLLALAWWRRAWPAGARPWVGAALAWWALLVASGWLAFLPGWSEQMKFTHGLVAHAHLAMAGLVTSVNGAILVTLTGRRAPARVFALWQAGCALQVAALLGLGMQEAARVDELFLGAASTQGWLGLRLAAGAAMTVAAGWWWRDFLRDE